MEGTMAPIGLGESGGILWPILQPWRDGLGAIRFRRGDICGDICPVGEERGPLLAVDDWEDRLPATDPDTLVVESAPKQLLSSYGAQDQRIQMLQGLMQSRGDIESVPWGLTSSLLEEAAGASAAAADLAMQGNCLAATGLPPLPSQASTAADAVSHCGASEAVACFPSGPNAAEVALAEVLPPSGGGDSRPRARLLGSSEALKAPILQLALLPLPAPLVRQPNTAGREEEDTGLFPRAWVAVRTPCQLAVMEIRGREAQEEAREEEGEEAEAGGRGRAAAYPPHEGEEGRNSRLHLVAATAPLQEFLGHVCWNPLCPGELAFTSQDGSVWAADVNDALNGWPSGNAPPGKLQPRELLGPGSLCGPLDFCCKGGREKQGAEREVPTGQQQQQPPQGGGRCTFPLLAEFGSHPRQLLTAGGRRLLRWQLPAAGGLSSLRRGALFPGQRGPVELLKAEEGELLVALSIPRTGSSRHCAVAATTSRVLLVDSRRPGGVLLSWRLSAGEAPPRLLSMAPLPNPIPKSSSTIGAEAHEGSNGNGSRRQDGRATAGARGAAEEAQKKGAPSAPRRSPTPEDDGRALFGWAPPRNREARPRDDDAFVFSQASNNPWDEEEGRGAPTEDASYGLWGNPYFGGYGSQRQEEEEAVGEPSFAWGSAPSDSLFGAPRFGGETQESQVLEPQAEGGGGGERGVQQEVRAAAEQGDEERDGGMGGCTLLAAASGSHGEVLGYSFRCGSATSRIEATSGAQERQQAVPRRRQSGPALRKQSGAILRVTKQGSDRGGEEGAAGAPKGALQGAAAAPVAAAGPRAADSGRSWGWTPLFCSAAQAGGIPVRLAKSLRRLRRDRLMAAGEGGASQPPEGLGSGAPEGSEYAEEEGLPDLAGMGMVSLEGRALLVRLDAHGNLLVHTCSSSGSEACVTSDTAAAAEAGTTSTGAQRGRGEGAEQEAAPVGRQSAGKKSPKGPRLLSLQRHRALVEGALRGDGPEALNPPTGSNRALGPLRRNDAEAEAALCLAKELRVPLTMREAAVDLLDDVTETTGGPPPGLPLRQGVLGASSQQRQQQRRRKRPTVSVEERMRKFAAVQEGARETALGRAVAHLRGLSSSSSQQELLSRYQIKIPLLGVAEAIDSLQQQQQQGSRGSAAPGGGSERVPLADRWARATVRKVPAPPADGTVLHSRQGSGGGAAAATPSRVAPVAVAMVAAAEQPGRTFPRRSSCVGTREALWAPSEEAQALSRDLGLEWGGGGGNQPPREARPAALPNSSQSAAVEQGRPRGDCGGSQQQQQQQEEEEEEEEEGLSGPASPRVKKKRRKKGRSRSWVRPSQQSQGF